MRSLIPVAVAACAGLFAGCSSTSSYLVSVTDRASSRAIEGATLELSRDALRTADAAATTDGRGEAVVVLPRDERMFLLVTFDGAVDRYFVRPDLVPAWDATPEKSSEPNGAVRFLAGAPSTRPSPSWAVRIVRLH